MAVQTSFNRYFTGPKPGFDSDQGRGYYREGLNKTGADIDVGIAVAQGSSQDTGVVALAAATDACIGIVANDQGRNPNGLTNGAYAANKMFPMKVEGAIYVQLDQDVKPGDPVFVRFSTGGAGAGVVGSFRKDADGVAQVATGTPTAVNSQVYVVRVEVTSKLGVTKNWTFEYQGDGTATATEIVTGFKTVMAADAAFAALITASGTTTLILTTVDTTGSVTFTPNSEGDGAIAWVATTPAAPHARKLKGARWLSTGTAANACGELYFSASAESP